MSIRAGQPRACTPARALRAGSVPARPTAVEADPGSGRWPATLRRTALGVVLLGLLWRLLRYALGFPIWGDEAFLGINLLQRDFRGLWRPLEYAQIAPLGFLWVERLAIEWLGASEWSLRLFPFLAGLAAPLLFWRFARRVAAPGPATLAVAIFAVSFYPVRHACEVKPYALDLLVALILTMLGWSLWEAPRRWGCWLALIATGALGVWFSYPVVFPLAAVGGLLAWRLARERSAGPWALGLAFAAATGASWLTMVALFAGPHAEASAYYLSDLICWRAAYPPLELPWLLPFWLLDVHAGNMLAYPYGSNHFGSLLTTLLVARGAVVLWRTRRPLLVLLLGPLVPALAAAFLHRYPYGTSARVSLYMAPAFCLLAGEGLAATLRSRLPRLGPVGGPARAAGLLALLPLAGMALDLSMPWKSPDDAVNRRMARTLLARVAPGDRLIVFNGATPPPRLPALMVQMWLQQTVELQFYLLRDSPVPTLWAPDPATVEPISGGRTWLVIHRPGWQGFPRVRLAAYRRALVARLGPPRTLHFPIDRAENVEVDLFPPRGS